MKYIIELEKIEGTELYKAKGFNTLVFDKNGLDKLAVLPGSKDVDVLLDIARKAERIKLINEARKLLNDME